MGIYLAFLPSSVVAPRERCPMLPCPPIPSFSFLCLPSIPSTFASSLLSLSHSFIHSPRPLFGPCSKTSKLETVGGTIFYTLDIDIGIDVRLLCVCCADAVARGCCLSFVVCLLLGQLPFMLNCQSTAIDQVPSGNASESCGENPPSPLPPR